MLMLFGAFIVFGAQAAYIIPVFANPQAVRIVAAGSIFTTAESAHSAYIAALALGRYE